MTATTTASSARRTARPHRAGATFLLLAGPAYFIGGSLHPRGGEADETKLEQLRIMFLDGHWYPSHALLILSMSLFAAGLLVIRRLDDLAPAVARVVGTVAAIASLATLAMILHLFVATQESAIRDGDPTFLIQIHTLTETLLAPLLGLGIAAVAVVGGLTRTIGNRIVLVLGLVGGLAYALASVTIPYTDRFDGLFAVSSTIGVWACATGVIGLQRR